MALNPAALPMAEAVKFWDDKVPMSDAAFKALSADARTRAFAVSGLSAQAQVEAVHAAIRDAVAKGESFRDFQGRVGELLKAQGWGSWRAETIYRTNVQQAYQAGRYAQMRAAAKARPFWRYVAVRDGRTRPSHLALHNLVYPHDHPFWDQFYPPNGFNCRCTVQSLTEAQVKERGLAIQEDMPELIEPVDPVTGERLPPLRPAPDAGFGTNAGQSWLVGLTPSEIDADPILLSARAICREGKSLFADERCAPPLVSINARHIVTVPETDILAKGLAPEAYALAFLKEFGVENVDGETTHLLPGGYIVPISAGLFKAAGGAWKIAKRGREQYVKLMARSILQPYEVWSADAEVVRDGVSLTVPTVTAFRLFRTPGKQVAGFNVWKILAGKEWYAATSFAPGSSESWDKALRYLERQRKGVCVYREP